jgi:ribosomal-protein-serine acetyltransferase
MALMFKDQLNGTRLTLKRTIPTLEMTETMFKVIDVNRKHLEPWMPWVDLTLRVEDTLKYLFEKEVETQKGDKVEYGIYIHDEYIGNICIFDINKKNQSAEIG